MPDTPVLPLGLCHDCHGLDPHAQTGDARCHHDPEQQDSPFEPGAAVAWWQPAAPAGAKATRRSLWRTAGGGA